MENFISKYKNPSSAITNKIIDELSLPKSSRELENNYTTCHC